MKKALLFIILISISLVATDAQTVKQKNKFTKWATANNPNYAIDSTTNSFVVKQPDKLEVNHTLTSGDYLIKASRNIAAGTAFGILSGISAILLSDTNKRIAENEAKKNPYQNTATKDSSLKSEKNVLTAVTIGFGITGTAFFTIVLPINLNKAGKAYNQEHRK